MLIIPNSGLLGIINFSNKKSVELFFILIDDVLL
jgi:hypothetical protein